MNSNRVHWTQRRTKTEVWDMVHVKWTISNGAFQMEHFKWTILNAEFLIHIDLKFIKLVQFDFA